MPGQCQWSLLRRCLSGPGGRSDSSQGHWHSASAAAAVELPLVTPYRILRYSLGLNRSPEPAAGAGASGSDYATGSAVMRTAPELDAPPAAQGRGSLIGSSRACAASRAPLPGAARTRTGGCICAQSEAEEHGNEPRKSAQYFALLLPVPAHKTFTVAFSPPLPRPCSQGVLEVLVDLHDGRLVAAAVAVVGRAEDRHDVLVVRPRVALGTRHERRRGGGTCIPPAT